MRWNNQRRKWVLLSAVAIAVAVGSSATWSLERTTDDADRQAKRAEAQTKRVSWEAAVGGMTTEQRAARQADLSTRLLLDMPDKALQDPVGVELTQLDRDDLAVPYESGTPLRIGVVKEIAPNIRVVRGKGLSAGEIQETADGGFVWAVSLQSPQAQAIRVHFTDFSLPEGAEMYFYSVGGHADGPYTAQGRNGNGEFWTRSVSSNTGVIQLHFFKAVEREISFTVSELAHVHSRRLDKVARHHDTWPCADNVACLVDATCADRGPAEPAKDAIAKMEWIISPYVYTCTGGLLADTVPTTQIPYFLTANHCTSTSISNLETWFNYTTESCNGVCPHNILTGGAPPSDTIGFTALASSATSDFCLGTLDEAPPAGAVFLGWNNSPVAFTNGADLYRISNANFGPQVYSQQDVDTSSPTCGGLPRGNIIYSSNNVGGTMGGSSGSPVVNNAGEVVGQLYGCCGYNCGNDCDFNNNWTIDGAFAVTWPNVEEFLDPDVGCTSDKECNDGLYCNGAETCDIPSGKCQAGTAPNCNDGVACTDDSCNEGTNSCDNVANDANCDNGLYCDGAETCDALLDCQAGTAPNCNDGVGCTDDSCNEGTDSCDNIANDGNCDNGQWCDGAEWCHATSDCQSGTAPNCNDGVGCTDDSCNEGTDSCDNIANDANCDNGLFCDGAETCDSVLDCQAGSDPCPGQLCDEGADTCYDCAGDPDCNDGLFCNGAETCVAGACQPGTAVDCNDGVGCTDDSCNEATDSCDNIINDASCDNGLYCDGAETCDVLLDCQAGTAPDCNDGVGCTDDSCNEATDSCDNIANDGNCDNGLYCDGAETCDVLLDCQAGTAPNCNDGVGCTDDSCNEVTDSCDNIANNGNCDNGLFCDGVETCDSVLDCQPGSDPCPGQDCDEVGDVCVPLGCDNDGTCESGEDCNNCPNDCISGGAPGECGNGVCEPGVGEDCLSCPADCNGKQVGTTKRQFCCGDGAGTNPVDCSDSRCNSDGFLCGDTSPPYCCGDGTCEGAENSLNCEVDCGAPPVCGDAACDPGEDQCSCPADCCATAPPTETACSDGCDNDCDGLTDGSDPDCVCGVKGDPCTTDAECCSIWCHRGACK